MEIAEIIQDSLVYPSRNLMTLIIYMVLSIVMCVILLTTVVGTVASGTQNIGVSIAILSVGMVITMLIWFLIQGYSLDIIKISIERGDNYPNLDFMRQIVHGLKALIVDVVYLIIPIIISLILFTILSQWLAIIISFVLLVIFGLAGTMGLCRLAKTEDMVYALNIQEAIEDVINIGLFKVLLLVIVLFAISFIFGIILIFINNVVGATVGGVISGIVSVYLLFFQQRAYGLLYSDI